MRKIILIIGKEENGKTRLSKQLADVYDKENQVFLSGRNFNKCPFYFEEVTDKTKVLIIDDLPNGKLEDAIFTTYADTHINRRGEFAKKRTIDNVIINMVAEVDLVEFIKNQSSLNRRVQIINLDDYVHQSRN